MSEESVVANIRDLTKKLNVEFQNAHNLGLKAHVSGSSALAFNTAHGERINVHVWREIDLLQVPQHSNPKVHHSVPALKNSDAAESETDRSDEYISG